MKTKTKSRIPPKKRLTLGNALIILCTLCCCITCIGTAIDNSLRSAGLLPTHTPTATATNTATPGPTRTPRPTHTPRPVPTRIPTRTPIPTPTPISGPYVIISAVNKIAEHVTLSNLGDQAQDLSGWVLVSERGNQRCRLNGILQPQTTLRIYAQTGVDGYNCGFTDNIWNDSEHDPAVLYNPAGQEIDRY